MLFRKRFSNFSAFPSISGICESACDGDRFRVEACPLLLAGGVLGAPSLSPEKKLFMPAKVAGPAEVLALNRRYGLQIDPDPKLVRHAKSQGDQAKLACQNRHQIRCEVQQF